MRVCLMIEGQEGVTWDDWVRLAGLAEQHGFEGLFRSDHYAAIIRPQADALDAWATLAGLATLTQRIRLGTLVSPATFRHPSVLARMAVTVDHISRGRVDVGMGSGWYEREHVAHGFPFLDAKQRFELFAEQVEIVVRSWTEDGVEHSGPAYELSGRKERLDRGCADAGRDPSTLGFSVMTACFLGKNRAEVLDRLGEFLSLRESDGDPEELRALGVTRVFLQHLNHSDDAMVALAGEQLLPVVA